MDAFLYFIADITPTFLLIILLLCIFGGIIIGWDDVEQQRRLLQQKPSKPENVYGQCDHLPDKHDNTPP
ncbi:hypothetical protein VT06_15825 [Arsukibacterium sp. MJ3]|uniref:hypothetical protein n=1 Tax=Arsukibacterium sp. MJ3 TaxID=1632859 RepID=UPI00062747AF|nr:hypothetical protein [Arsukibacterium sp. MJ3]KKO47673.1 hypothetical protein VT06_15825 [Arsukibacterium sp. MJ3]